MGISINKDEILSEYNEKVKIIESVFYDGDYFRQARKLLIADICEMLVSSNVTWRDLWNSVATVKGEERFEFDQYKVKLAPRSIKISTYHPDEPDGKQYTTVVYELCRLGLLSYEYIGDIDTKYIFNRDDLTKAHDCISEKLDDELLLEVYRRIKRRHMKYTVVEKSEEE